MNFTPSQLDAVTVRDSSVLVSAGAGSGKTRVLTERLMEYIDPQDKSRPPENVDSFLIITFTRAAAGELRARIAAAIAERLRSDPKNTHLRAQMLRCRSAQIGTIHSFCSDLLRRHAEAAGISPAFRILEEERGERMRAQALERVLEKSYEDMDPDFLALADSVGLGRDDRRLSELVLRLHAAMQSHARPDLWAEALIREGETPPASVLETRWGEALLQDAAKDVAFHLARMTDALAAMTGDAVIARAYSESFSATASALERLLDALSEGWDAAAACFPIPFPTLKPARKAEDPELLEDCKARRDACKKAMEKLALTFRADEAAVLAELHGTAPAMAALLRLALKLDREFARNKRRLDLLDFGDLEHLALRLLVDQDGNPTAVAREVASRFREVMVDEYQDVSRVQDLLFHAVSREGKNLFFVGDVKQSIYRFRLADPAIFTEKSLRFGEPENARGEKLIRLRENFRSHPAVIDAVNAVFCRCMSRDLGDIDYRGAEELIAGRPDDAPGEKPELILLNREDADDGAIESEARVVAAEIRRLLATCRVPTEEGDRPLSCGDIAVLLRAANTVGGRFRRILLDEGIPVAAGFGGDFYASTEVNAVFSMLCLLDHPHQDIPLLSLLRSPCFGFSPDDLSRIRALRPDADWFTDLCAADDPESLRFLALYRSLRPDVPDCSPKELTERVIEALDLYTLCSAMPDSERRLGRLDDLRALAESFMRGGEYGLHRYVTFLKNQRDKNREPVGCSEGADAVRLLSIHRSKGLEFPVVFCCGLGRTFNRQDLMGPVLIHPVLGLGPKFTDTARKLEYPTAARRAVERRLQRESLSEEMRLLYVAMTRARERLILTACVKNPEKLLDSAARLLQYPAIPAPLLQDVQAPLPWVLPAAVDGRYLSLRLPETEQTEQTGDGALPDEDGAQTGTGDAALPDGSTTDPADEALDRLIAENLSWVYPRRRDELLPSKITATELKAGREAAPDPDAVPLLPTPGFAPKDLLRSALTAAERGTAMHMVLQQIDFSRTGSLDAVRGEIARLAAQDFLTPDEAAALEPEKILAFFRSEIGRRILAADSCRREFRFSLLVPNTEDGFPDLQSLPAEPPDPARCTLLQGSVDCFFEEDGALIVVDYKTDRVAGEEQIAARAESYRIQLDTYAYALRRIFSLPVRERILYFLRPGRSVTL